MRVRRCGSASVLGVTATSYPQRAFSLPAGSTEILLVRHGASQAHVPGEPFELIEGGHANPPLAPEGLLQAERVGARLRDEPFSQLFVTPLQRTLQTAAPLAAATGTEPRVVHELREVHLGEWENGLYRVKIAEGDPIARRIIEEQRWDVIPGAEPMESFAARIQAGIGRIAGETGPGQRAIAFLHGGVIGEIAHQAVGGGPRLALFMVENASVSSLLVHGSGRWQLRSFNDTLHLRG